MKKIILVFCTVFIVATSYNFALADDYIDDELDNESIEESVVTSSIASGNDIKINSRIAIAYDRDSGEVIWGKDENKKTAMASTTKIMTAIVTVENGNLDDEVIISAKAAGTGGSRLGLKKGDKITLRDLLYGLMLRSGNDAAIAIAEHVGGNVQGFADLMNEKAKELQLKNTHFVTPHGLDDPNHYTTAYELAKITDYALKNDVIAEVVKTKNHTININGYPKNLTNTNELLGYLNGVYGVKTGFTNNAGRCLVTAVKRENLNIITIVLQADTKKDRTRDSISVIEHIYNNYEKLNIQEILGEQFQEWCNVNKGRITIDKAKNMNADLKISKLKNDVIVVKKCEKDKVKIDFNAIWNFEAPVSQNTRIGKAKVTVGDEIVDIVDIYIANDIEKKDMWDYFLECLKAYKQV